MNNSTKIQTPDFLTIPYQLIVDDKLQQLDRLLYGVIYWQEKMRAGKCISSNAFLAEVLHSTAGSIANSLINLENRGYIKRFFKDEEKKNRSEIKCNIYFRRVSPIDDTEDPKVSPTGEHKKNNNIYKNIYYAIQQKLIPLFKEVNPDYASFYRNSTQRRALDEVISHFVNEYGPETGPEKLTLLLNTLYETNGMKYAPVITTPLQLKAKLGTLIAFIRKEQGKSNKVIL